MNKALFEENSERFLQAAPSILLLVVVIVSVLFAGRLAVFNESRSPGACK